MVRSAVLVLAFCLGLLPVASNAQVNPFRSSRIGSGLSDQDRQMMSDAGARLYENDTVAAGAKDQWSNPASGNGGTVTVLQNFTQHGMACHKVKYDIRLRARTTPRSYTVNWCKTASGAWKMV
jgi:surface antigen